MAANIDKNEFIKQVSDYTGVELGDINENTNLYADLGMDSLGLFSLGMFLIKTFNTNIPLSAVATIETIGDFYHKMNDSAEQNKE